MDDTDSVRDTAAGLRNGQPFTVEVEFLSDWACGTGTARHGAVDREVQRDADGLPMLRGKALAAVLRDAAETVAVGLDDGDVGTWHAWVEAVFGSQPGASSRQRLAPDAARPSHPRPRAMPVPAALRARPLRLPAPAREAIAALDERSRVLAREAAVSLRPGVAIDADRHTAADDTFRIEERAAVGLTVTADWQLAFAGLAADDPVPWEAELLLRAAARLVDAIGGKRRRGAGRCRVTIAEDRTDGRADGRTDGRADGRTDGRAGDRTDGRAGDRTDGRADGDSRNAGRGPGPRLAALLDRIDQARPPAEAVPSAATDPAGAILGARTTDPPAHRHDLRITALTPLLVARGVIGNLVLTERFVPGTSLLPMVAKALGEPATELITGGRVVVTNATVEVGGKRSLPVPRALHRPKETDPDQPNSRQPDSRQPDSRQPDSGQPELVNLLRPRTDDSQRLRPMVGFCVADGEGWLRVAEVDLVTQAHAVVDDGSQRPTEDSGGLFVYQAIAAGTVLRGELWLPADAALDADWLDGTHAIGRSRKDDYGHVRVEVLTPGTPTLAQRSEPAQRSGPAGRSEQAGRTHLTVWLLSDLLLRGPAGEPVTDPATIGATLGERLGVTLTLPEPDPGEPPTELVTTRRAESWQRRWSMPRPSLIGLAAGSVIRFDMTGTPAEETLRRVEATGLGERTAEGYGRLALQPRLLDRETVRLCAPDDRGGERKDMDGDDTAAGRRIAADLPDRPDPPDLPDLPHSPDLPDLAVELLRRGWRRELHRTAAVRATDDTLRDLLVPPGAAMAQLGALRTLADRLTADNGPAQVRGWIAATRRNRPRRQVWGTGRLDLLRMLASGDEVLWAHLGVHPPAGIARELHGLAAGWLLTEVVRAEVERRRNRPSADEPAAAQADEPAAAQQAGARS